MADWPPSQSSIDALNTATPNWADLADIAQCTYMHGRYTPQSIEHRCLEYCYTKLGRSSFLLSSFAIVVTLQLTIFMQFKCSFSIIIIFIFNCHHFATDRLHEYIQFTVYHLEVHFQCSDAQAICAISHKTYTLKLQLLHNTKRPTKWSGHVKMIDPLENFYIWKTFYPRG